MPGFWTKISLHGIITAKLTGTNELVLLKVKRVGEDRNRTREDVEMYHSLFDNIPNMIIANSYSLFPFLPLCIVSFICLIFLIIEECAFKALTDSYRSCIYLNVIRGI